MLPVLHPDVLTLIHRIHGQQRVTGLQEFARAGPQGVRTIYRWYRDLGQRLRYYPHAAYAALGLHHLHLFLTDDQTGWRASPYAIEAVWTITAPGTQILYVHCLIPTAHRSQIARRVAGLRHVWTGDGWQTIADLHRALDVVGRPVPHDGTLQPVPRVTPATLLAECPFAVPVLFELLRERRSMEALWRSIHARLGARTWSYFSRRTRRWLGNGKVYVQQAYTALNEHGVIRQHIVRYQPLAEHTIEVFLHSDDPNVGTLLEAIGRVCPVLERYPTTAGGYLVRVRGDHRLLQRLVSTKVRCAWWFIRDDLPGPAVAFAYEALFDPITRSWRI